METAPYPSAPPPESPLTLFPAAGLDNRLASAVALIHQRALTGLPVHEVVRHSGLSRSQLEKRFRRAFARSPQAEIRRIQLQTTRQLLHTTDWPIKRIAHEVGFVHAEYLCVVFKRVYGVSPGAFRKTASSFPGAPTP